MQSTTIGADLAKEVFEIAVFVKWATDHPERHHERRSQGLYEAWREAFPCPE
jgi:hypothetical protein